MKRFGKLIKRITVLRSRGGVRKRPVVRIVRLLRRRRKMRLAKVLIRRIRRR